MFIQIKVALNLEWNSSNERSLKYRRQDL